MSASSLPPLKCTGERISPRSKRSATSRSKAISSAAVTKRPHEAMAQHQLILLRLLHVARAQVVGDEVRVHAIYGCGVEGGKDVRRGTRTRERNEKIALLADLLEPSGKYAFIANIISPSSKRCSIERM